MSALIVEHKGHHTEITLNRPTRINALNTQIFEELASAFESLDESHPSRAVLFRGAGEKGFCSGGDVDELLTPLSTADTDTVVKFGQLASRLVRRMRECPKPIVVLLHGAITGAGAALVLASDIRIAADNTRIAFVFTKIGLGGADLGITYLLPRFVGFGKATELLLLGDFIDAPEALRIGLVNRVVATSTLESVGQQIISQLALGPPFAMAETKRMLNAEQSMSLSDALQMEVYSQALCMQHQDFRQRFSEWKKSRRKD